MLKLNTLVDAAAAAAPFRTVRRFKFVFDLSTMFTSPTYGLLESMDAEPGVVMPAPPVCAN
jgi:hypothetical protein